MKRTRCCCAGVACTLNWIARSLPWPMGHQPDKGDGGPMAAAASEGPPGTSPCFLLCSCRLTTLVTMPRWLFYACCCATSTCTLGVRGNVSSRKKIVVPSFSICCYCLGRWEAIWDTAVVEAVLPFEFLQRLADMFNCFTVFFILIW